MTKRYQIFVSSTFEDLKEERQAVLRAILEVDHMPAGMELFPATDEAAWDLIKEVIDQSDYYVVIVGGRYGSLSAEGVGFTEMEYDYAHETGKPVIALLHGQPGKLPREKTETDLEAWDKLEAFRSKLQERHTISYWSSASDLRAQVVISLTSTIKKRPGVGWVRGNEVPSDDVTKELLTLRGRVAELELEQATRRAGPPPGADELQQGDETLQVEVDFRASTPGDLEPWRKNVQGYTGRFRVSWNEMWGAVAPTLIDEAADLEVRRALRKFWESRAQEAFGKEDLANAELSNWRFSDEAIDTCFVQFRALGLMEESIKKRSLKETRTFWRLTEHGDKLMVRLRAIHREAPKEVKRESSVSESTEEEA